MLRIGIGVMAAFAIGAGVFIAAPVPVAVGAERIEANTSRPGGDYRVVRLKRHDDAETCNALCEEDGMCKAWTYVKGDSRNRPRCRLKSIVPERVSRKCCVSGVKIAATPPQPQPEPQPQPQPQPTPEPEPVWHVEQGIDRGGGDYEFWDLALNDTWDKCQAMCVLTLGKCKAWTYAIAGVHGPQPRCYLKSTVPVANSNPNAVSGYRTP
ncbi:MAG: PAN domain-containing protein [Propylenella sp.]